MTREATEQAVFEDAFLDDDFFSESVTYTASGAVAKTIDAVIYRKGTKSRGQRNDGAANSSEILYDVEIAISRDATAGIATVTPKSDIVSLPLNLGAAATTFRVGAIIKQDLAAWYLGLLK